MRFADAPQNPWKELTWEPLVSCGLCQADQYQTRGNAVLVVYWELDMFGKGHGPSPRAISLVPKSAKTNLGWPFS